jgi:hypothetical protein
VIRLGGDVEHLVHATTGDVQSLQIEWLRIYVTVDAQRIELAKAPGVYIRRGKAAMR